MNLNKDELDNLCHVLEKYIDIYEDYDMTAERSLLKKLMTERWSE